MTATIAPALLLAVASAAFACDDNLAAHGYPYAAGLPIVDKYSSRTYRPDPSPPAPLPVVPIERGAYYSSNPHGSTYWNINTGVHCQSNSYGTSCY